MMVGQSTFPSDRQKRDGGLWTQWSILGLSTGSLPGGPDHKQALQGSTLSEVAARDLVKEKSAPPSKLPFWNSPRMTRTKAKLRFGNLLQDVSFIPSIPKRTLPQHPSALPRVPDISDFTVSSTPNMEYAILVSMYEVYNDRIFDLLMQPSNAKESRRRPLLFKSTEGSPDRKVVAGLRKIVCGNYEEAIMVLETGLLERRVAGTGSNSVSSRSHGFFCVEVKKRPRGGMSNAWSGSHLTIVDLAGNVSSWFSAL